MLKNNFIITQIILILICFSIGFAQTKTDQLFEEVESYLNIANEMNADVLCKEYYNSALENYNNAHNYRNDRSNIIYVIDQLNESIKNITILNSDLDSKADFFSEAIELRDQAQEVNSPKYATEKWENAEQNLQKSISYYENRDIGYASEILREATESYSDAIYRSEQANDLITSWGPFNSANENLAQILAPQSYHQAMVHFDYALDNLAESDMESYQSEMLIAEDLLTVASNSASDFAGNQTALVQARKDAKSVGAEMYAADQWLEAEEAMMNTASKFEEKDFADMMELSLIATNKYDLAKTIANKERFLSNARSKINLATEANAGFYAPITMNKSQLKLNKAIYLIDKDSKDYDQIKKYAANAGAEADKALQITNMIKSIENGNSTLEQVILGWNILGNKKVPTYKPITKSTSPPPMVTAPVNKPQHRSMNSDKYKIDESDSTITITLTGISFGHTKSLLDREDKQVLDSVVPVLNSYADYQMTIKACTDKIGPSSYNKKLSEERAQNVADYLQNEKYIPQTSVEVYGAGEEDCIYNDRTFEGRLKNNRVELILIKN